MQELQDESLLPKGRLETLCDGIFAIAMTLMILDLKTPENIPANLAAERLPEVFYKLLPSIEAYALSFLILGIFWLRHQIQFKYIRTSTRALITINLFFLMLIGFVPFTVGVMMRYPDYELPFRIYLINLFVISILLTIQWIIVNKSTKIIATEVTPDMHKKFLILTSVPAIIFLLSFIISFFSTRIALFIIYIDPVFYLIYRKLNKTKDN